MTRNKVFISYSHEDEKWKHRLSKQLMVLERQGLLRLWCDRDIGAGQKWRNEIDHNLQSAKLAVLVISADFLASEFVINQEVPRLLNQHEGAGMRLFPVLIRDCDWGAVPWLARLQMRPLDAKPVAEFPESLVDRELAEIAREVREYLSNGRSGKASSERPNKAFQPKSRARTLKQGPTRPRATRG